MSVNWYRNASAAAGWPGRLGAPLPRGSAARGRFFLGAGPPGAWRPLLGTLALAFVLVLAGASSLAGARSSARSVPGASAWARAAPRVARVVAIRTAPIRVIRPRHPRIAPPPIGDPSRVPRSDGTLPP